MRFFPCATRILGTVISGLVHYRGRMGSVTITNWWVNMEI